MIQVGVKKPEVPFVPVTVVLNTPADVANVIGALIAYGTGKVYAENSLKAIGLGDFYSGNVRKAARELADQLAAEVGADSPDALFEEYRASDRFGTPSQAGAKVRGTDEDLAPDAEETHFEDEGESLEEEAGEEAYNDGF
jgi:hypothetical protein